MASSDDYAFGAPASTGTSPNADSPRVPAAADPGSAAHSSNPRPDPSSQPSHAFTDAPPPGATVYPPAATVSASLNPRSCVTCRKRKVRCDKHMPCGNCRRAQIQCVFPAPGRAPRRPRPKDPNAPPKQTSSDRELELMKRLRKLEGVVEELSGQIELEAVRNTSSSGNSPEANALARDAETGASTAGRLSVSAGDRAPARSSSLANQASSERTTSPPLAPSEDSSSQPSSRKSTLDVGRRFGRLVLNDKGTSRYVSSGFWSTITDELDEIRAETQNITEEDSEESDIDSSPASLGQDVGSSSHQSFVFGYRSADADLKPLHPLPSQIPFIWQVYQENVEPLVKVLHVPSVNKLIREIGSNLEKLTPPTEALMFAIYYAAITSLDQEEVKVTFGADRQFLLSQYRFALEQALSKAEFLTQLDLTICQAFLIFLVIVRHHDQSRFTWSMTALIARASQAMGLHRDGSNFPKLSPFEVEMRRRLFWAICVLDIRSSEDLGTDLTLANSNFDTQLPLNINDSDLDPDCQEAPKPREGYSDMTFALVRYDMTLLAKQVHYYNPHNSPFCPESAAIGSIDRREALLAEGRKRFDKYLKFGSPSECPKFWVATNVARLILAKMTLLIYQPVLFPGPGNETLPKDCRERLFIAAIEIFEYNHLLNTDPRTKRWRWLFKTYTQWHAIAYVLLEMPHRPWCPTVERAWYGLINTVFGSARPGEVEKMTENAAVWLPLKALYHKAKKRREAEIERLRSDPDAARQLDREAQSNTSPDTFGAIPSSLRGSIARERWRKLVNAPPPLPTENPTTTMPPQLFNPPLNNKEQPVASFGSQHPDPRVRQTELIDHFMDDTMNTPFVHTQLLPLAWSAAEVMDTTGYNALDDTGNSSNSIRPSGTSRTSFVPDTLDGSGALRGPGYTDSDPGKQRQPQTQQQQAEQARLYDPPPWLWPSLPSEGVSPPEDLVIDDLDVSMDEGFNWQTWQESVRGFEAETSGSVGLWGAGF